MDLLYVFLTKIDKGTQKVHIEIPDPLFLTQHQELMIEVMYDSLEHLRVRKIHLDRGLVKSKDNINYQINVIPSDIINYFAKEFEKEMVIMIRGGHITQNGPVAMDILFNALGLNNTPQLTGILELLDGIATELPNRLAKLIETKKKEFR